jgi:hypothetical protein
MKALPLFHCAGCGRRAWWRLPPGSWLCSTCRPWWADPFVVEVLQAGADAAIVAAHDGR